MEETETEGVAAQAFSPLTRFAPVQDNFGFRLSGGPGLALKIFHPPLPPAVLRQPVLRAVIGAGILHNVLELHPCWSATEAMQSLSQPEWRKLGVMMENFMPGFLTPVLPAAKPQGRRGPGGQSVTRGRRERECCLSANGVRRAS
jgi:hypothetical protein